MKAPLRKHWFSVWPEGMPKTVKYSEVPLYELLKESAEKHPNKLAIEHEKDQISYEKLDVLSDNLAAALVDMGIKKGCSAIVFLPNIPEFIISYYAIIKAGGVVASVNPLSKEMELEHALNNSESETIITHESLHHIVEKAKRGTNLRNIIVVGEKQRQNTYRREIQIKLRI